MGNSKERTSVFTWVPTHIHTHTMISAQRNEEERLFFKNKRHQTQTNKMKSITEIKIWKNSLGVKEEKKEKGVFKQKKTSELLSHPFLSKNPRLLSLSLLLSQEVFNGFFF